MLDFVGRAAEFSVLRARLAEARDGRGQLVLVTGEPGIGKTRLAEEFARHADGAVGWGRASEDEGCPPYWIFRQLLCSIGRTRPDLFSGAATSAQERFEAFETLAADLRAAAEADGLLVVLDDLQWADAASLALLVHMARGIGRSRLMIVATYRDTESTGREALSSTLSALARESNLTRIRLVGLTPVEVGEQLLAVAGTSVPPETMMSVSRRSGGNPFFVAELGRLLATDRHALPDAVVDAVRARLAALSDSCRALIATAATLGDLLDPAALAEVTERQVPDVLADLDEAATAGIISIVRTAEDPWRFDHDLIRESARLELPTALRLTAHARLAARLQNRADAAEHASEIAHHWQQSLPVGDPEQASLWAERAAEQALSQLAWEDAAGHYRRARETGAPLAAAARSRLWRGEGVARLRGGEVQAAFAALTAAGDAAREADDPMALGEVALVLEGVADPWESLRGADIARQALARLPAGDTPLRARLLALIAGEACLTGGSEPERTSAAALAMAERLGDTPALRSALRSRQMVRSHPGGVHERLELGNRMLSLGLTDDDTALWGRLWRFDAMVMLGHLDDAEAELRPIGMLADRLHRPIARWHHLRSTAAIATARGRFDDAITATLESLTLVEGHARDKSALLGSPVTVLTMIGGLTGRTDLVTDQMIEVLDRGAPHFVWAMLASYRLCSGDRDAARHLYARASGPEAVPVPAMLSAWAAHIGMAAEFGPSENLASIAAKLRPYAELFVAGGAGVLGVLGSVHTYLGIAAAGTGRLDDAVRELRLGVAANDGAGTPPFAALARFELAKALARRRRPTDTGEAAALAASVTDAADRLGMAPLRRDARALAGSLRGDTTGPLTPREREVAAHVAQGLTNKQIAALMHISERTAETHVQHILAKLALRNRTHIATWARDGLRTGPQ